MSEILQLSVTFTVVSSKLVSQRLWTFKALTLLGQHRRETRSVSVREQFPTHMLLHQKFQRASQSLYIFHPHLVKLEFGMLHHNLTLFPSPHPPASFLAPATLLCLARLPSYLCNPYREKHSSMETAPDLLPSICSKENSAEICKIKKNNTFSWFE